MKTRIENTFLVSEIKTKKTVFFFKLELTKTVLCTNKTN